MFLLLDMNYEVINKEVLECSLCEEVLYSDDLTQKIDVSSLSQTKNFIITVFYGYFIIIYFFSIGGLALTGLANHLS